MSRATLTMSHTELSRLEVVQRTLEKRLTQREGARILGVSVRQLQRLCRAYRDRGPEGLVSGKRGRPSNRRAPEALRKRAIDLVAAHYSDFGPTFACEKLAEQHEVFVSRETLRKWMVEAELWVPRKLRRRVQQPRGRRPCLGELVQIDGCDHEWFEDRGPRCTLLVYIDDATSRLMELRFVDSESTFSYFQATRAYLERHGKPVAFYSDKASIFRPTTRRSPTEPAGVTQFGRALSHLNVDILCANTPAAKGRVERAHLTLQDRLVKELRLRGISTIEEANRFAPEYMRMHNARFAHEPLSSHDAHRSLLPSEDLDRTFTWQEQRKLTKNLTLCYRKLLILVEPGPETRSLAGRRVQVYEWEDGHIEVVCDGRALPFKVFDKQPYVDQGEVVPNKRLGAALAWAQEKQQARDQERLASRKVSLREKAWIRDQRAGPARLRREDDISTLPTSRHL